MSIEDDFKVMAAALRDGTGYASGKVPEMKGKMIFGSQGEAALIIHFIPAINEAFGGEDDARIERVVKIMTRMDELADERPACVIGRLKAEITDLSSAEGMFLVSYLHASRSIMARPDEVATEADLNPPQADPGPVVVSTLGRKPASGGGTAGGEPIRRVQWSGTESTEDEDTDSGGSSIRRPPPPPPPPARTLPRTKPLERVAGVVFDLGTLTPPERTDPLPPLPSLDLREEQDKPEKPKLRTRPLTPKEYRELLERQAAEKQKAPPEDTASKPTKRKWWNWFWPFA